MSTQEALKIITERIPYLSCPVCGSGKLRIQTKFITNLVSDDPGLLDFTSKTHAIPTLPIICGWCGYVLQHALAVFEKNDANNNHNGF